jgi:hypothetical protein
LVWSLAPGGCRFRLSVFNYDFKKQKAARHQQEAVLLAARGGLVCDLTRTMAMAMMLLSSVSCMLYVVHCMVH